MEEVAYAKNESVVDEFHLLRDDLVVFFFHRIEKLTFECRDVLLEERQTLDDVAVITEHHGTAIVDEVGVGTNLIYINKRHMMFQGCHSQDLSSLCCSLIIKTVGSKVDDNIWLFFELINAVCHNRLIIAYIIKVFTNGDGDFHATELQDIVFVGWFEICRVDIFLLEDLTFALMQENGSVEERLAFS